ncbi:MAG: hypothetical protein HQK49_19350 [Oligoflexia bacterium]|nr:hypothetical protein [Oligoflexia bacterium]
MKTANKVLWNESLKVGHIDLDGQHRLLIELINSFFDIVIDGTNTGPKKLEELEHYIHHHIDYEEGILSKLKYSDLTNHQMAHSELTSIVSDVTNRLLYLTNVDEQIDLINNLQNFWVTHIKTCDHLFKQNISNLNSTSTSIKNVLPKKVA